jgi:hypothetical protein
MPVFKDAQLRASDYCPHCCKHIAHIVRTIQLNSDYYCGNAKDQFREEMVAALKAAAAASSPTRNQRKKQKHKPWLQYNMTKETWRNIMPLEEPK